MIRKSVHLLLVCLLPVLMIGQHLPTNTFRSKANVYYWQNRLPYAGYWQQDTYYNIKVSLDDKTDIIDGDEELTYWNNSPDTLAFVFFHLYQNSFQPGSYLDDLQKNNGAKPYYGKYERAGLGTTVDTILIDGKPLRHEIDYSIMKVWLDKPLASGESVTFKIKFKTYYDNGSTRRRMKKFIVSAGFKHYDGVLFYPRISVYDKKFGWDTNQHLNREFYGDYGCYDVAITLPSHYILDATGVLQNKEEVMPDSLRKILDIKNFVGKKWDSDPSIPIIPDDTKKTWRFHSENTHDFAFTCDPTYRIGEVEWKGIKCIALAQESHAGRWQNAADFLSKIIQCYSRDIGMYAYPKIVVADAADGMEYPMLTLDGGQEPGYRYLFAHEVGHNWFYGMVGNNETYRAALDEGFTQFLTSWGMDHIDGPYEVKGKIKNRYVRKHFVPQTNIYTRSYMPYLKEAIKGEETTINTHSDYFNGALNHGGYGMVYYKTSTMLYNLEYVLGDSLFLKAMQHYFHQWKFCHPYIEDFRNSIIQYTHADLNWFFDAWMETNKTIDYGIKNVKKDNSNDSVADKYLITFKRYGRMQMPIEFRVYANDGRTYDYLIPCNWFTKNTDANVLPKWEGWDKLNPTYVANICVPSGIENIRIDTSMRIADVNLINNSYHFPYTIKWDSHVTNAPDWAHYEFKARPDIWYNYFDGIKLGLHINGNYMNLKNIFDINIWGNFGLTNQSSKPSDYTNNPFDYINYRFNYKTPLNWLSKGVSMHLSAKYLDGLESYSAGLEKAFDKDEKTILSIGIKAMYRQDINELKYLLYQDLSQSNQWNNTINIGIRNTYSHAHGTGTVAMNLRSNTLFSDYNFASLNLLATNKNTFGKIDLNARLFAQYTTGNSMPLESQLYLAGANPEELMDNKYTRSRGFVNENWLGYGATTNHFQEGGGLNLRGFAGYLVPQQSGDGKTYFAYKGSTGESVSGEIGFDRFFSFIKPKVIRDYFKVNTYLFGDAGIINYNSIDQPLVFADLRADAGVGVAITIKKWGPLQAINPLIIRFDMPLVLNRVPLDNNQDPSAQPQYFKFRFVVGINRTF